MLSQIPVGNHGVICYEASRFLSGETSKRNLGGIPGWLYNVIPHGTSI